MKILLSSSKKQNHEIDLSQYNIPKKFLAGDVKIQKQNFLFEKIAQNILKEWQQKSQAVIKKEMKVSDALAEKTFDDFKDISQRSLQSKIKNQAALFTYTGEVYRAFHESFENYSQKDFEFVQENIFIMSGLFGLLHAFDEIPPYRLEMKLTYKHWQDVLTDYLLNLQEPIINLASAESTQCLDLKKLKHQMITPVFKEKKGDQFKIVAVYAKKARGIIANWIVQNKVTQVKDLKKFTEVKYKFNEKLSSEKEFVFARK